MFAYAPLMCSTLVSILLYELKANVNYNRHSIQRLLSDGYSLQLRISNSDVSVVWQYFLYGRYWSVLTSLQVLRPDKPRQERVPTSSVTPGSVFMTTKVGFCSLGTWSAAAKVPTTLRNRDQRRFYCPYAATRFFW